MQTRPRSEVVSVKRLARVLLIGAFLFTALPFGGIAGAASVEPELYKGNPKLPEGCLKIEDPVSGRYQWMVGSVPVTVTVTVRYTDMGQVFDWSSTYPISQVVAKGGREGAYIYKYGPGVTSDTYLHAPMNPSGKWADLSWIGFCPGVPGGGNGAVPEAIVSGAKFYDRDTDGVWDLDEPPIAGWPITLEALENGVAHYTETVLTNEIGEFEFGDLPAGTYRISEATPPAGSPWRQTAPASGTFLVEVEEGEIVDDLYFGNVCMVRATGGLTLGFWSNRNGQAVLARPANAGWMALLTSYNLVNEQGLAFDPTSYSAFRTWLLNARAVNMSYMLSAQMSATLLNTAYAGANYNGQGVIIDGRWVSIADVIHHANTHLGMHPVTRESSAHRSMAEMYKDIFDGLNNNTQVVIPYAPYPLPIWP